SANNIPTPRAITATPARSRKSGGLAGGSAVEPPEFDARRIGTERVTVRDLAIPRAGPRKREPDGQCSTAAEVGRAWLRRAKGPYCIVGWRLLAQQQSGGQWGWDR